MNKQAKEKSEGKQGNDKPVSLAPLSFDEAVKGLLATKPIKNEGLKQKSRSTKKQSTKR